MSPSSVHCSPKASTVSRSRANRAPLGCGERGDLHQRCIANLYHLNMDQSLSRMFLGPRWKYTRSIKAVLQVKELDYFTFCPYYNGKCACFIAFSHENMWNSSFNSQFQPMVQSIYKRKDSPANVRRETLKINQVSLPIIVWLGAQKKHPCSDCPARRFNQWHQTLMDIWWTKTWMSARVSST